MQVAEAFGDVRSDAILYFERLNRRLCFSINSARLIPPNFGTDLAISDENRSRGPATQDERGSCSLTRNACSRERWTAGVKLRRLQWRQLGTHFRSGSGNRKNVRENGRNGTRSAM